jgi:hypothetical protein
MAGLVGNCSSMAVPPACLLACWVTDYVSCDLFPAKIKFGLAGSASSTLREMAGVTGRYLLETGTALAVLSGCLSSRTLIWL